MGISAFLSFLRERQMPEQNATKIEVALAEVRNDLKHLAHDVKNALQKQEGYVTRREHEASDERISAIESNQTWAARAIIGAWIAGAGVIAFGKRLFT